MSDFEVLSREGSAYLVGHLGDSAPLQDYEELIQAAKEINFSKLYSVSWMGLQRFLTLLSQSTHDVSLNEIPSHVYRLLLMFPEFGERIHPHTFYVEVFGKDRQKVPKLTTMDELLGLAQTTGAFVSFAEDQKLSGSLHHLCRPLFGTPSMPTPQFASTWASETAEECLFWYDYTSFVRIILESSALAQRATTMLIEESLQKVLMRIMNAQQACKVIEPEFKEARVRDLLALLPYVQQMSQQTAEQFAVGRAEYEEILLDFQSCFSDAGFSRDALNALVSRIAEKGCALVAVARVLDTVGVEIGEKVFTFGEFFGFKKMFENAPPESLTEKNISSIRRKMKLPQVENADWNTTLQDIQKEFRALQDDLNHCVIAMQGFDLIRQVFEHRIHEATILKEHSQGLTAGTTSWLQAQDAILDAAMDKLVTDQEKFSFGFFFPDRQKKQENKLQPGEISFF